MVVGMNKARNRVSGDEARSPVRPTRFHVRLRYHDPENLWAEQGSRPSLLERMLFRKRPRTAAPAARDDRDVDAILSKAVEPLVEAEVREFRKLRAMNADVGRRLETLNEEALQLVERLERTLKR